MSLTYVALGSNLGDRRETLSQARLLLEHQLGGMRASPFYSSPAEGDPEGPDFLNAVLACETSATAHDLLHLAMEVEHRMGRVRRKRNAPRTIDIDILDVRGEITAATDLHLPHPRMWGRLFVLLPLADVNPDYRYPATGEAIRTRIESLLRVVTPSRIPIRLISQSHGVSG